MSTKMGVSQSSESWGSLRVMRSTGSPGHLAVITCYFSEFKWLNIYNYVQIKTNEEYTYSKLILKERYIDYKNALKVVRLVTLEERRQKLCLKFAKACVRHEKLNDMFPKQRYSHNMDMRQNDKFVIKRARTERLKRSAVVNRLLNQEESEKRKLMRQINLTGPVNYDCF